VQLCDGCVASGADVVRPGRFDVCANSAHEGVGDVVDVDIVMGGTAVAVRGEGAVNGRPAIMALPRTAITPAAPCGFWRGSYSLARARQIGARPYTSA
jgi:hypothetical protein